MLKALLSRKSGGDGAERIAEAWLTARGFTCIARNYRCRLGEIDLVMDDAGTLVFVEVRYREGGAGGFGGIAASITPAKQRRIVAAARHFLAGRRELPPCRFDAVLMNRLAPEAVEWLPGAFEAA